MLTRRGAWWIKTHAAGWARAGLPDLIIVYAGSTLAIELKQPGQQPTLLQQTELRRAHAAGAIARVIHTRAELEQLLDALDATGV